MTLRVMSLPLLSCSNPLPSLPSDFSLSVWIKSSIAAAAAALFPCVFIELLAPHDFHSKYFQCTYCKLLPPLCICAFFYLQHARPETILGSSTTLSFLPFKSSLYIFLLINLQNNDCLFDFLKTQMQFCARTVTLVLLLTSLSHSG